MRDLFKKSVLNIHGYESPPQKDYKVKLNQNESPFDVPKEIKAELSEKIINLFWNRYPENEAPALKQKLAERYNVRPEQILLGNGSNQLFQTLLTAIINPGDKLLYTPPTFSLYDLYTEIYDGELITVFHPPGEKYPIESVLQEIRKNQPKIILICSPNNPTGFEIDLKVVQDICKTSNGLVFFDEAYCEFTQQSAIRLLDKCDNLLISRTFSKAFCVAGLRFGYFIAGKEIIEQLRKVNLPYNINVITETIVSVLLSHSDTMQTTVNYLIKERERVYNELRRFESIITFPSRANFLLIKERHNFNLFEALKKRGVLIRDVGKYPLLEGFQRVTIGFEQENDYFLMVLKDIISDK